MADDDRTPMPSRRGKGARPGGRSAKVRAAVLREAFGLLLKAGLEEFSIAAVARRADVHESSIYRRWETKTALLLDACLNFAELNIPSPATGCLRSDLITLLRRIKELLESPQGRILQALVTAVDPEAREVRRQFWRARFAAASEIVERAKSRGEIVEEVDSSELIEALVAPLHFRAFISCEGIEAWPIESMVDLHLTALRPAFTPSPS
jgi:AcrR family transcriptional regulator